MIYYEVQVYPKAHWGKNPLKCRYLSLKKPDKHIAVPSVVDFVSAFSPDTKFQASIIRRSYDGVLTQGDIDTLSLDMNNLVGVPIDSETIPSIVVT